MTNSPPSSVARLPHAPLLVASIAVLAFFVVLNPPGAAPGRVEADEGVQAGEAFASPQSPGFAPVEADPFSATIPPEFQAAQILLLRVGPDERHMSIGQIGRGAGVEVVGRNEKGDWLAVSLNPGSSLYGWVKATMITGVRNISALPVTPVKLLP